MADTKQEQASKSKEEGTAPADGKIKQLETLLKEGENIISKFEKPRISKEIYHKKK